MTRDVLRRWWVPLAVGLGGLALCVGLAFRGPVMFFDAGSYVAVADNFAHGHGFTTTLVPTFSEYSSIDFLHRGGRIPFTDFPAGFAAVLGVVAWFAGARKALLVVALAGSAVLCALIVQPVWRRRVEVATPDDGEPAAGRRVSWWHLAAAAVFALAVLTIPAYQWMLRGGLAEPLFCALLVGASVLALSDRPGRLEWAVALAGIAGNIRFIGLPCVLVPAIMLWRRGGRRRGLRWTAIAIAPSVVNSLWAAAVGSGHRIGLREVNGTDARIALHSITGWVSYSEANVLSLFQGLTYPAWWGVLLAVAWLAAAGVAVLAVLLEREWLPRPIRITFALAGMHTAALVGGMLLFDSLVAPDSRLMLPAGILTLTGLLWWLCERVDGRIALALVVAWVAIAVQPWNLRPQPALASHPDLVAGVGDARVVVSNDADAVYWWTGTPAAYLPWPKRLLTGEAVDRDAELAQLPCLLDAQQGVVVLVLDSAFADQSLSDSLDQLVAAGDFTVRTFGTVTRYTPTGDGCG